MLCKNKLGQATGIYPSPLGGAALFSALRTPTAACFSLCCTVGVQPKSLSLDPLRKGAGMGRAGFPVVGGAPPGDLLICPSSVLTSITKSSCYDTFSLLHPQATPGVLRCVASLDPL